MVKQADREQIAHIYIKTTIICGIKTILGLNLKRSGGYNQVGYETGPTTQYQQ